LKLFGSPAIPCDIRESFLKKLKAKILLSFGSETASGKIEQSLSRLLNLVLHALQAFHMIVSYCMVVGGRIVVIQIFSLRQIGQNSGAAQ
jgi:hypothetical protein